jgi:hypothetical protein
VIVLKIEAKLVDISVRLTVPRDISKWGLFYITCYLPYKVIGSNPKKNYIMKNGNVSRNYLETVCRNADSVVRFVQWLLK